MKIFTLTALLVLLFSPLQSLRAEENTAVTDFTAGSDISFGTGNEKPDESDKENNPEKAEITIIEDKHAGEYISATLENISKLYWNRGVLLESNDTAVDNFLLINECDIYTKFFTDDFEWQRIRDAGRDMIKANKENFSSKFKMVIPIDLGRYDMKRKGFPLINKTALKDLRRVELGGNSNKNAICGKYNTIEYYPRNLILILSKPFSYEFVELDEHIAQAFIIRQKYQKINRPKELENKTFDRLAFARMRITFSKYQGETRGSDNFPLAIMFGSLDGIDIFEDAGEKRLLTSIDYK